MRNRLMPLLAVALSLVAGLAIAEVVFRIALPPVPGDEISALEYMRTSQRQPGAPRLFPANFSTHFDIRGLYEGASQVTFRVGPNRFVEPEPGAEAEARYRVLFLGGSVTEGIFLQSQERWPARLNEDREIAAYNASMSEAGMLAQYLTAKYLSGRGDRFDLVVLATNHNDSTWSRRFANIDARYRFANFTENWTRVVEKEFVVERKPEWISLRTLGWTRYLLRIARLNAKAAEVARNGKSADDSTDPSVVVHSLRYLQGDTPKLPKVRLADCDDPNSPDKVNDLAYEDWKVNLPEFRREMKRLLGAELLVVSEPVSYGAPATSFFYRDNRVFPTCKTRDGLRGVDIADTLEFERRRATAYLDAAKQAGALTFDLAAAMDPFSNGPEGGRLFFDSIHPTPKGAEKFAELLRPALKQALESLKKD